MYKYHLKTEWRIEAPLERVYDLVVDSSAWTRWWPDLHESSLLCANDNDGIGSIWQYVWNTYYFCKIRFTVKIVDIEIYKRIVGRASGDLEGLGTWCFYTEGPMTIVTYEWEVCTTRWWMRVLSPCIHQLFEKNHEIIMRRGGEGLAKWLGVKATSIKTVNLPEELGG